MEIASNIPRYAFLARENFKCDTKNGADCMAVTLTLTGYHIIFNLGFIIVN